MSTWQEFENKCGAYLNATYGNGSARFVVSGGSDSHAADIKVYVNGANKFNMEIKSATAQSGQFVVLEQNGKFIFSPQNKSDKQFAGPFIAHMNQNYAKFKNVASGAKEIDLAEEEFNRWIIAHYLEKNARFVITGTTGAYVIFPVEKYGQYFKTSCVYRIKKSGSTNVPPRSAEEIKQLFKATSYRYDGKYFLVNGSTYRVGDRLTYCDHIYFVSAALPTGELKITRLSNTRNANVIFSINLIKNQDPQDLKAFEEALR